MDKDFEKKESELIGSRSGLKYLGFKQSAQFRTKAGVSDLFSGMAFQNETDEQSLAQIPDYILSDTLEKDLDATINVCAVELQKSKYLPNKATIGSEYGAVADGQRQGAFIKGWQDFEIIGCDGNPIYTAEIISNVGAGEQGGLETAFSLWLA